ncbi:MAG: hypothetical protein HYY00_05370 [Chloroflexi bacterium]|nr:hypothetical protein [Chloroflexota bacterium]
MPRARASRASARTAHRRRAPSHRASGKSTERLQVVFIGLACALLGVAGAAVLMGAIAGHLSGGPGSERAAVFTTSSVVGVALLFWLVGAASSTREVWRRFRTVMLVESAVLALVSVGEGAARLLELFG